jgi:hypothetical protein
VEVKSATQKEGGAGSCFEESFKRIVLSVLALSSMDRSLRNCDGGFSKTSDPQLLVGMPCARPTQHRDRAVYITTGGHLEQKKQTQLCVPGWVLAMAGPSSVPDCLDFPETSVHSIVGINERWGPGQGFRA